MVLIFTNLKLLLQILAILFPKNISANLSKCSMPNINLKLKTAYKRNARERIIFISNIVGPSFLQKSLLAGNYK